MTRLEYDLLSRFKAPQDALEDLRTDLQDSLKEYGDLDLFVELLQNALDAVEDQRYRRLCDAAGLSPTDNSTVTAWNQAVDDVLEAEHKAYGACDTIAERALFYKAATNDAKRRTEWWGRLAGTFGCDAQDLSNTASDFSPELNITVVADGPIWVEVEDNGPGMADVVSAFRHKQSKKRPSGAVLRRYGLRGSHGWGLTAVLGMSNMVEVISRSAVGVQAFQFKNYASFAREQVPEPENIQLDICSTAAGALSERLRKDLRSTGTHVRVQLALDDAEQLLAHTLANLTWERLVNLLRMYTPVGQVNDYLLHPAYHTYRKDDLRVILTTKTPSKKRSEKIPFDTFRIAECSIIASQTFEQYVNSGMPENQSVHTIHRSKKNGVVYLSAAEIQPADPLFQLVESHYADRLPTHVDEDGKILAAIPRGFNLALSGGMRAELVVRPPRSTSAAFRGFVLAENLKPTLGRKHVMDQRQAPPRVASEHESRYEEIRKKLLPAAVPPVASPASAKWRREFFEGVINDLKNQCPATSTIYCQAGKESLEARVMLVFGELLQQGTFGDLRILRAHLQDKYDFAFLYRGIVDEPGGPTMVMLEKLRKNGWLELISRNYFRYGIGEFKALGHNVFDDFDPDQPRKAPDTIDLLVCWSFDPARVADEGWSSDVVMDKDREFIGQTHTWHAASGGKYPRNRQLAVVCIEDVIKKGLSAMKFADAPSPWQLPTSYY